MRGISGGAVGVDPDMDLQAARFGLGDEIGKGVVAGVFPLGASEIAAPRFESRIVECVGFGADLQQHCIEAGGFGGIEQAGGLLLLDLHGQSLLRGKVDVVD